ncbi:MAG: pantoate--beta-alanine ligase [Bacteroidota bacterium]
MLRFSDISSAQDHLKKQRSHGKTIGLVPTMGALHDGHYSLIRASLKENDVTLTSIFVNRIQFNKSEDFENYPVNLESDISNLEKVGNDIVFTPSQDDMYPEEPVLSINFGRLAHDLEGEFRPGHFSGVGLVVSKLLNIVNPDRAYFGQKDLQQFAVISRLVKDLSYNVELRCIPTLRTSTGLALSSRNRRLSTKGLQQASILYKSLIYAKEQLQKKVDFLDITREIQNLCYESSVDLEYFEIVNPITLESISEIEVYDEVALCIAGYVEGVRLIDNMIVSYEY